MPTARTEGTELSVAFGLLRVHPVGLTPDRVDALFDGTLTNDKFRTYLRFVVSERSLFATFHSLGARLRAEHPLLHNATQVAWTGPQQQAATTTGAKDLFVANVPISIKNESNVVLNASPYNLFVCIPSGMAAASNTDNWFARADPEGVQALYAFARDHCDTSLPAEYTDFDETASRDIRRQMQACIRSLGAEDRVAFDRLYTSMCMNIAQASADEFNRNITAALGGQSRAAVMQNVVRSFFRVNGVPYTLAGIDAHQPFAVTLPDITTWTRTWRLAGVTAAPAANRGQSVVNIAVVVENKQQREQHTLPFHVEVRWSHGKFCGNPEGKLYKEFAWSDVPFFTRIF